MERRRALSLLVGADVAMSSTMTTIVEDFVGRERLECDQIKTNQEKRRSRDWAKTNNIILA